MNFHPYDWEERDDGEKTEILAWCFDETNNINLLRFHYPITCYLELPINSTCQWNLLKANDLMIKIKEVFKDISPDRYQPIMMKKLYYYTGEMKYPFLELFFHRKKTLFDFENRLQNENQYPFFHQFKLHETVISPIRKMLTERKCRFSSWCRVKVNQVCPNDKISSINNEFFADYQTLELIPSEESLKKKIHPRVLSWDIEAHSMSQEPWTGQRKNYLKKRPFPNPLIRSNEVFLLSAIYQHLGQPETKRRFLITTVDCLSLPQVEIIKAKDEKELVDLFLDLIEKLDIHILTGFNIHGFDYRYLDHRLQRLNSTQWINKGSLLYDSPPYLYTNNWASSGTGHNDINYLVLAGRLSLDLYSLIKRQYKMRKYKLENVAQKFLGKGKEDVKPEEIFEAYDNLINYQYLQNFINNHDLTNNNRKEHIDLTNNNQKEHIDLINNQKCIEREFQITPEVENEVRKGYREALIEITRVSSYCIQDSELVIQLFEKTNQWNNIVEMSNVAGVSIMDVAHKGQGIRGTSLIYDGMHQNGYVLTQRNEVGQGYHGAVVIPPKIGRWDHVMVLDFNSLYPSIIIAQNICYTTLIHPRDWNNIDREKCNIIQWDENDEKEDSQVVVEKNGEDEDCPDGEDEHYLNDTHQDNPSFQKHFEYRFIKAEYQKGILPQILERLINSRKETKKQMKIEKDFSTKQTLDSKQLAEKISANSIYGYTGTAYSGKSRYPCFECAQTITAFGRNTLNNTAKRFEKEFGAEIITGDTDSIFFRIPSITNYKETWKKGREIEEIIKHGWFPKPLTMELEKTGRVVTLHKKNYDFWKSNEKTGELIPLDSKDEEPILCRGTISARGDSFIWLQDLREKLTHSIFIFTPLQQVLDIIVEEVVGLVRGQFQPEDLACIKNMGSDYKSENFCLKIFAEELTQQGQLISPGDKLEYVIVENKTLKEGEKDLLGKKMRLLDQFQSLENQNEKIDIIYYLEHLIRNSVDQLWDIIFGKEVDILEQQYFQQDCQMAFNELLSHPKLGSSLPLLLQKHQGDYMKMFEELKTIKGMKTRVENIIRKHITGRNMIKYRIDHHPIKTLVKSLKNDQFQACVKGMVSPEVYHKLYPLDC